MGSIRDLFVGFVTAGAFIFCVTFTGYVWMIVASFRRRPPVHPGDAGSFDWHFIVPCLDEERSIEETLRRLISDFPGAHVWCVDDASQDASPAILDRISFEFPRLHVVSRLLPAARNGKGSALNAAWAAMREWMPHDVDSERVIVGVIDADGRLALDCPSMISGTSFFGDPSVGAVQIKVRLYRDDEDQLFGSIGATKRGGLLLRLQDVEFTSVFAAMQMLRRGAGSVGMGGNGQFARLSVLDRIAAECGTPWHGALLEDLEFGLHVLLAGSRTAYCHDTWVAQEGIPTVRALLRQRCRWAQGAMQCLRYLWPVLQSERISTGGALEIAYFLFLPWLQLFGSLFHLFCSVTLIYYVLSLSGGPNAWLATGGWGFGPLVVVFGLLPIVIWGPVYRASHDAGLSRRAAWLVGLAAWPYTFVHYGACWWAFARVLRSRGDWKKTVRVLDRSLPGALPQTLSFSVSGQQEEK